ncbi:MAG: aldo/keto reductase, partial [Anaerolineales bacterium]|nr:aldo/keto reductase [Anaerolineales bacterium]
MEALWSSDRHNLARYDSFQPHYSLAHRAEYERELATVCQKYGLGVIPYSPLAAGFLTGKYRKDKPLPESVRSARVRKHMTEQNWAVLDELASLAKAHGKSISQMALGWLLSRPEVTAPIIGPRTIEQLNDNLGAVGLRLNAAETETLEGINRWDS